MESRGAQPQLVAWVPHVPEKDPRRQLENPRSRRNEGLHWPKPLFLAGDGQPGEAARVVGQNMLERMMTMTAASYQNESLSWEERYAQLEKHHEEETARLATEIENYKKPPYARTTIMKSAEVDELIEKGIKFPIRTLHGLEFRGLLGDIVKEVTLEPTGEKDQYQARVVIVVRCVESGFANREVIFETQVDASTQSLQRGLTVEQEIVLGLLQHLVSHEIQEDLRLDGKHIVTPKHEI